MKDKKKKMNAEELEKVAGGILEKGIGYDSLTKDSVSGLGQAVYAGPPIKNQADAKTDDGPGPLCR